MNFLNLTPLTLGIGLAGIAGILFLLQQLRIRYTELPIATTMFWAAAVREAPVRVLRQRFRHLLAYLLALLICWLLWIGFGAPMVDERRATGFSVLVLDGSAHSATADVFEQSKSQLLSDISGYPRDSREVFLAGANNVRVLAAGEENMVLVRRLEEFEPVAARSSIDELLRVLPRNDMYPEQVNVLVYGNAPVPSEAIDQLPDGFNVARRTETPDDFENRGIVALGIGEAMSGDWDKVDVLFRVLSTEGLDTSIEDLSVQSGGVAVGSDRIESISDNEFRVRDVEADGSTFEVVIEPTDELEFDNVAQVNLPDKDRIRVTIGTDVPVSIRRAIQSDNAVQVVQSDPHVAVVGATDDEPSIPYFRTVPSQEQYYAFSIGYTGDLDAEEALRQSVASLGLTQIDAAAMATDLDVDIEVDLEVVDTRFVSLWSELVGQDFNFKDSMSFPLFISKAIRYLANQQPWYAYVAAGRRPYEQTSGSSLARTDLLSEYAAGTYYVRNEAGVFETEDGDSLNVSLLDSRAAIPGEVADLSATELEMVRSQSAFGLVTWLILLVLVLLGLEWFLYQRGLMP